MAEDGSSKYIGILIIAFVAILIGAIGATQIATNMLPNTQLVATSETLTIDNTNALINDTFINQSPIYLGSHTLLSGFRTDYTSECEVTALDLVTNHSGVTKPLKLDYNFTKASGATRAYITIAKAATDDTTEGDWIDLVGADGNTTTVSYRYCGDGYVGGWGNTIEKLVPGFFALAVLAVAIFLVVIVFKKQGLL